MTQTPSRGVQRIVPYLCYADAPAAIDFLCKAFGFQEQMRVPMPGGRVGHAELVYADNTVMLASSYPELGFQSPRALDGLHSQIRCEVDDVDAHHARAREAGATVVEGPEDQPYGDRVYRAVDPEGHRWIFASRVRDVPARELRETHSGKGSER